MTEELGIGEIDGTWADEAEFAALDAQIDAAEAAEEALRLHERKQNVPGAEQARALLASVGATG